MAITIENVSTKKDVVNYLTNLNPSRAKSVISAIATFCMPENGATNDEKNELEERKKTVKAQIENAKFNLADLIQEKQTIQQEINGVSNSGNIEIDSSIEQLANSKGVALQ